MSVLLQQSAAHARHALLPHWLTHLGALGLFSVAVVDSSVVPLPLPGSTDLLLLWLVANHGNPYLLASSAVAGSILGGYTTWYAGRKGGEAALHHSVPARLLAYHQMGRASSCARRLSSGRSASAHSTLAFCARIWRAWSIAAALSHCVWCGAYPAILTGCMARRYLRKAFGAPVVWNVTEMVDTAAMGILRIDGRGDLFRDMEE